MTVDKPTAERLKKLGYPQKETYFQYWYDSSKAEVVLWDNTQQSDYQGCGDRLLFAAPDLLEVLDWLKEKKHIFINIAGSSWGIHRVRGEKVMCVDGGFEKSPSEALRAAIDRALDILEEQK